jgi:hypothetical protein
MINLFNLFLVLLFVIAGLSVYFSFFRPIEFSRLIHREDVKRYAEVEILLPDDLAWLKTVMPAGEERRDVFNQLDWVVSGFRDEVLAGRVWVVLTAKILVSEKDSGVIRYGKYTLAKGGKIFLINDRYLVEGRVYGFNLLEEKVLS